MNNTHKDLVLEGEKYNKWLCEVFPQLFYIKIYIENNKELFINKKIVLLINYNEGFIKESLNILNFENIIICPYKNDVEYKCKTLYMLSPYINNNPSKESITLVRQILFKNNILVPKINIIIKNEKIENFEYMIKYIKEKYGNYEWIIYDKEEYKSIFNKIQIFSVAKLIIGLNEPELSNIIFCGDKSKVIELHPINCGDMYYWNLSNIIDNTYNILPVKYKENGLININIDELDYTIDKLLNDIFCIDNI